MEDLWEDASGWFPSTQDVILCSVCKEEDKTVPGVQFCCLCDASFCVACLNLHARMPVSRHHDTRIIDDTRNNKARMDSMCATHKDEEVTLYCQTCKETSCQSCRRVLHLTCADVVEMRDMLPEVTSKLRMIEQHLEMRIQQKQDCVKKRKSQTRAIVEVSSKTESQIKENSALVLDMLRAKEVELLETLETMKIQNEGQEDQGGEYEDMVISTVQEEHDSQHPAIVTTTNTTTNMTTTTTTTTISPTVTTTKTNTISATAMTWSPTTATLTTTPLSITASNIPTTPIFSSSSMATATTSATDTAKTLELASTRNQTPENVSKGAATKIFSRRKDIKPSTCYYSSAGDPSQIQPNTEIKMCRKVITCNVGKILDAMKGSNLGQVDSVPLGIADPDSSPVLVHTFDTKTYKEKTPVLKDVLVMKVNGTKTIVVTSLTSNSITSFWTRHNKQNHSTLELDERPHCITAVSDNMILATAPFSFKIFKISVYPDLRLSTTVETSVSYYGLVYLGDSRVAVCVRDTIWENTNKSRVDILDLKGNLLKSVPVCNIQSPDYACLTNKGDILMSDLFTGSVVRVSPNGRLLFTFKLQEPGGIAATSSGYVLCVDRGSDTVVQMTEEGERVRVALTLEDGENNVNGICLDEEENVYVTSGQYVKVFSFR